MFKLKSPLITAIDPVGWASWYFVTVDDDTYTDNEWDGCDYRVTDPTSACDGLAIDIHITGRKSTWNGVTYTTAARIVFPRDGHGEDTHTKGVVYSTQPLF